LARLLEELLAEIRSLASAANETQPHDQQQALAKITREREGQELVLLVCGVPESFLRPELDRLLDQSYGSVGAALSIVLASRFPREFVARLEGREVPDRLYEPLVVAAHFDATISARAKKLVPGDVYERVASSVAVHGVEAVANGFACGKVSRSAPLD
jgi:hypothetical protein